MLTKALTVGFLGLFALSGSTCGKSNPEDATTSKEKPAVSDVVLEGVDTSSLTPREKKEWGSYVSEFLSPCQNVPVSIAQCVQEKRPCSKCLPAAKYILRGVKDGLTRELIEKSYKNRFDPDGIKDVAIDGSPAKGPESAPVTIVEFADFECPYCGQIAPAVDKLVEQRKNQVRLVYKFFPLPGHPHSDIAARAAIAAWRQGKFWEMHHALYSNQRHLEQSDLDSYAKELGLDISRFHADMQSNETTDRIARDRKLGDDVKIEGTPSFFINGRAVDNRQDMSDWISLELSMMDAKK
ncbi:MAG: thioredoxin domain-containing protein [Polyangiaceae bacterium]|nr:thioredoxin domain-containing protein [Polyangiaceae bacterium]